MKLSGEYRFEAPNQVVWETLLDPEVLAATLPGCEKLERDEETGRYSGELRVKVGPVNGKFQASVDLEDVSEPETYTMKIDGRGAPGFVQATAVITLEDRGETTVMRYDADARVGGRIAGVGQRLVETSAKAITQESLEGLHENVRRRAAYADSGATRATGDDSPASSGASSTGEAAEPPSRPEIHRVDESKVAAAVARDVARSLVPVPVLWVLVFLVLAILGWFALG